MIAKDFSLFLLLVADLLLWSKSWKHSSFHLHRGYPSIVAASAVVLVVVAVVVIVVVVSNCPSCHVCYCRASISSFSFGG